MATLKDLVPAGVINEGQRASIAGAIAGVMHVHGGSSSTLEEIREAVSYGVVKMNIDTDLQWALWEGIKK